MGQSTERFERLAVRYKGSPDRRSQALPKGVERIDDFFTMEQALAANEIVGKAMADYHDLVESGRREIYRLER